MIDINTYIKEGFKITKDITLKSPDDPEFYETCDIPEYDKEIDKKLDEFMKFDGWKYFPFKRRKTNNKNMNWYQFYSYIYYNGPMKRSDIVKALKGNTNSQYAELFTDFRKYNLCTSEKGLYTAEPPKKWTFRKF